MVLDRRVFKEAKSLVCNGYKVTIITWAMRLNHKSLPESYDISGIKIIRIFQNVVSPSKSNIRKLFPCYCLTQ